MTLALASDHRGFPLKSLFSAHLKERGHAVVDYGAPDENRCDAGDFAQRLIQDLRDHPDRLGVLICGTGQVMAMTANRYRHIRAALCLNTTMARLAREHNDANVLALGARLIGIEMAKACLEAFLATPFAGGRHADRVVKLSNPVI